MNSDPSPNYIQFNSLYQRLNTARWKARLSRSAQTNLSNLSTQINHSIVIHNFQYPFNLIGNHSTDLIAVTHQFKAWDEQKVQYTVIILIHLCFVTQYPIIRTGHRGDCPLVTLTWWDIQSQQTSKRIRRYAPLRPYQFKLPISSVDHMPQRVFPT